MSVKQIIQNLSEELKEGNRKEIVESYEQQLSKNIEELLKIEDFFNLPLNNIFSVISKVNFSQIYENGKMIEMIQDIIKMIINKHFEEKETILILQNLNIQTISFLSCEDIFSFLELITNCPILVNLCFLYKEENILPFQDYEFQIQQQNIEIENLKQSINKYKLTENVYAYSSSSTIKYAPFTKKPFFFLHFKKIFSKHAKKENLQVFNG